MRIKSLAVQGFRAFGLDSQRMDLEHDLAVIWAANSQGKSSIAEAVEFLLTGTISRRALHGGARAEFEGCLRNVHLDQESPVFVEATFEGPTKGERILRRELVDDFTANRDCTTRLVLDGEEIGGVDALGIPLSEPPLRAPVLMQHSLRYPLAASPKDRAKYLKAVLDLTDLDEVRNRIKGLGRDIDDLETPTLQLLARCRTHDNLADHLEPLAAGAPNREAVELCLMKTMASVMFPHSTESDEPTFDEVRTAFLEELETRQAETFPTTDLDATADLPAAPDPELDVLSEHADAIAGVQRDVHRLHKLFEAVLDLPETGDAEEPVQCPVCGTEDAFTPERRDALQRTLETAGESRKAKSKARQVLQELDNQLRQYGQAVGRSLPPAASWGDERERELDETVTDLLEDADLWLDTRERIQALRSAQEELRPELEQARDTVQEALTDVTRDQPANTSQIETALNDVRTSHARLAEHLKDYLEVADALREFLAEPVRLRSETAGWPELAELSSSVTKLLRNFRERHTRELLRNELKDAVDRIDDARARVLDQKLADLSDEIQAWWDRLRPDEPIDFGGLGRRGTGQRFIDLRAQLTATAGEAGVNRHAAGVLSDSQLNALGLCAFLARTIREGGDFVILDDPVPASDEEHRATFTAHVVDALVDEHDLQLIVTTHDSALDRMLRDRYEFLPIQGFQILLEDPAAGAAIEPTKDTFEAMLAHARRLTQNRTESIRANGATGLRRTAERFCKEALVAAKRDEGVDCSIVDFDEPLGRLVRKLEPYIKDPSHLGKLENIRDILNPGAHDNPTPSPEALRVVEGDLKYLRKQYT